MLYVYDGGKCEEGKALAVELIRHGVDLRELANILGVTYSCVYRWRQLVRPDGWEDSDIEIYDDPDELHRKLQELHGYKGLFSTKDMHERTRQKMLEAGALFEQGASLKEIREKMHVSCETVVRWRDLLGYDSEKSTEKAAVTAAWVGDWCRRWDEFMASLERPLRLAGETDE